MLDCRGVWKWLIPLFSLKMQGVGKNSSGLNERIAEKVCGGEQKMLSFKIVR